MRLLRHPAVHWGLALVLGGIFLYASFDKIAHPREFARIVYHYRLAGPSATLGFVPANTLAVVLPWVEAVVGVLLITGIWRREAAIVAAGMLVTFVVAVGYALAQGIDIANCGCFSVEGAGRSAGWTLVAGDLALLAAAWIVAAVPVQKDEPAADGEPAAAH